MDSLDTFFIRDARQTYFREFLRALPIPALLIDRSNSVVFANRLCGKIAADANEIAGRDFLTLFPDQSDAKQVQSQIEAVFSDKKPRTTEVSLTVGGIRILGRLNFKFGQAGVSKLVLVLIEKLTSETTTSSAEHLLRKNEQLYRQLVEEATDIVFQCDRQGLFTFVNPVASKATGYSEAELIGKHYLELIHPDYRKEAERFYGIQYAEQLPSTYYEFPFLTAKGEVVWVGQNVRLMVESGKVTGFQAICRDITERKRMEDALKESEERFRAIFEGAEDYIFLKDRSLKYIDVNPAGERLLGLPRGEIVGRQYKDLFGREDAAYLKDVDTRVLQGQSVEEEHVITISGIPTVLFDKRVPLRDNAGEIVGVLTISRDVTDRKRTVVSPKPVQDYRSRTIQDVRKSLLSAAKRNVTILLTGESGSGKDYLAKYIHDHSDRANGPYFSINCAAIAPELAESELFGHEKGAFTGAVGKKRGLVELAEGGTLLLNEIGDLSLPLQAKLLTFLDTKKFTRVGGEKEISVNARLIAATNRDLEKTVEEGGFRKDLFYRLNVVSIRVPPLRERLEDMPVLVQEILARIRDEMHIHEMPVINPAAMDAMKKYNWPGNVRELRNILERAIILSHGREITSSVLGLPESETLVPRSEKRSFCTSFPNDRPLNEITKDLKRFMVSEALRKSGGNRQKAAKLLGISRYSLKHYMSKLGYADDED